MTPERAIEICAAINARCFYTLGVGDQKMPPIGDLSLCEMLEAKALVEERNRVAAQWAGPHTIMLVPAERLIAAVYCMEHYRASQEPILRAPVTPAEQRRQFNFCVEKVLAITPLDEEPQDHDTEDDPADRKCRVCGCTDADCRQCIERTGEPCHWVEDDLCSACVNQAKDNQ